MRRSIGISIVAARRPQLLAGTLASFDRRLLRNFRIAAAVANIDPVFGSEEDGRETEALLRHYFPEIDIRIPQTPGFGAAVRENWARCQTDIVFHLEDDWRLDVDVDETILRAFDDPAVAQVALLNAEKKWSPGRGNHHMTRRVLRIGGYRIRLPQRIPRFTAGPSFLRGEFARACARLMDERLDPEKQFFSGVNPNLERYVRPYRNLIFTHDGQPAITDTGREWRGRRGIVKTTSSGVSTWDDPAA